MSNNALRSAVTGRTAVATADNKPRNLIDLLASDKVKAQLAAALPKHISADRMARVIMTELRKVPKLAQCEPQSFMSAVMMASQVGLEPGGALGHCYLIPFENRRAGTVDVQFIMGYRGMLDLARRSGQIVSIEARAVYAKDEFHVAFGLQPDLRHDPAWELDDRGPLRAVYAVANLKDGGRQFEVMSVAEVERVRNESQGYKTAMRFQKDGVINSPWVTHFEEMAKKGLALDTPIPTPAGWSTMGDLCVDDFVFDKDGRPTKVTAVSEVKHLPCFRVTFSNGDSIVCDDEHRWLARFGGSNANREPFDVHTVNALYDAKRLGMSVTIPIQGAIDLPVADLPIDPYILGYWLGDGKARAAQITCNSADLPFVMAAAERAGYGVGAVRKDPRADAYSVNITGQMQSSLRALGLIQNKHVPAIYLRGSVEQRRQLLMGLMDSDGCIDGERGRAKFCSTDKALSEAVFELASSLGELPSRQQRLASGFGVKTLAHYVEWKPIGDCVSLPRKAENLRAPKIKPYRSIKSIERVETVPTKCIAVASDSRTYLAGQSMAITHNTVLRRLFKWLPMSVEAMTAVQADENADAGRPQEYIDAETGEYFSTSGVADERDDPPPPDAELVRESLTYAQVADLINKADSPIALDMARDSIPAVADEKQQAELKQLASKRLAELQKGNAQ